MTPRRPDYAAIDAARLAAARAGLPREETPFPRLSEAKRETYQRRPFGRAADGAGSGGGYRVLPGPRGGHA